MKNQLLTLLICTCLPAISTAQLLVDYLSEPRTRLCATANGGKVFFAGGWTDGATGLVNSDVVDIYDTLTFGLTQATLSVPRRQLSAASIGTKSYFIGGNDDTSIRGEIDIYDTQTNLWTLDSFPVPRSLAEVAVSGTKLVLAGGLISRNPIIASDTVTIWETNTGTWSGSKLGAPVYRPGICEVGGKVFVSGGWNIDNSQGIDSLNSIINILDVASGVWDFQSMTVGKTGQTGIGLDGKAYLIGGATLDSMATHSILVYDIATESWSEIFAPNPHATPVAMSIGKKIFIAGGCDIDVSAFSYVSGHDAVDVYDTETSTWESFVLTEPKFWGAGTAYGTRFFIAGGYDFVSSMTSDVINIFESPTTGIGDQLAEIAIPVSVWPNPVSGDVFQVELPVETEILEAYIADISGHRYPVTQGQNDGGGLVPGTYFLVVKTAKGTAMRKFVRL